jgi:hypothetical protein
MKNPKRAAVLVTLVAATVVFAYVQDRGTASGIGRYVTLQREAMAGQRPAVAIDQVMRPAVASSVRQGLMWGAVVLIGGLGAAAVVVGRSRS